ncbi:MAG: oxygen-dependent coproporphyrinogen oxidase [Sterolibacterium sp.]|nr:oxygen-dependent coproporphyrinogen oxidase [Sterolibacterium sp.]
MTHIDSHRLANDFRALQTRIVAALAACDGQAFRIDDWQRPDGSGHGSSQLIEEGHVFERGGVNFSHVRGTQLPAAATAAHPELAGCGFEAMGVSLVLHPRNPHCPTAHMNVRCFLARRPDTATGEAPHWWFGGGMDLTPYYPAVEDVRHFHATCRAALAPFEASPDSHALHQRYKTWCDDYFFIRHRQEARGVGGLFFDDLNDGGFERCRALAFSVGEHFIPAYLPLIERRRDLPWTDQQRDFQEYRRGRYVEFNLVQDRGTLFGLQSGGRSESILMSLPPMVRWRYDWQPQPGSAEARLYTDFLPPRDWLAD